MGTLFSMTLGTAGSGPERWSIWLPIRMTSTFRVQDGTAELGSRRVSFTPCDAGLVIEVQDFASDIDARDFLSDMWGALLIWGVWNRAGIILSRSVQDLHFFKQTLSPGGALEPLCRKRGWDGLDGAYDASAVAVLPQHKRLLRESVGGMTVIRSAPATKAAEQLAQALGMPAIRDVATSGFLSLAAETYLSSLFAASPRARLLELTTVLEILAPGREIDPPLQLALDAALSAAKAHSRDCALNGDSLNRLLSRLGGLKRDSIKECVRAWTRSVCLKLGGWDVEQAVRDASRHYDTRSLLVHEGTAPAQDIEAALAWLSRFVPDALSLSMMEVANKSPDVKPVR